MKPAIAVAVILLVASCDSQEEPTEFEACYARSNSVQTCDMKIHSDAPREGQGPYEWRCECEAL